jgi:undecaprenyl-diphosphatase
MRGPEDQGQPTGPEWMIEVARDVTALGGLAVLVLIILSVAGFLWLRKLYGPLILVGGASISGLLLSLALKELFNRPRPDVVPHLSKVFTSSFPSGHSMLAATVYLTLGVLLGQFVDSRVLRAYFLLVALGLTLLVGLSRVYLGVHYPTDVLAGWSAGLAWALLCSIITLWLQKRGVVAGNIVGD